MGSELLKIIKDNDSDIVVFIMKMVISIISPSFCVIFYFNPKLLHEFNFKVILVICCTVNAAIICILFNFLSDKLKVINKINLKIDNKSVNTEFMKLKKKIKSIVSRNILELIIDEMLKLTIIIIVLGIMRKYITCLNNYEFKAMLIFIAMIFIGKFNTIKVKVKESAKVLEEEIKYNKHYSDSFEIS